MLVILEWLERMKKKIKKKENVQKILPEKL